MCGIPNRSQRISLPVFPECSTVGSGIALVNCEKPIGEDPITAKYITEKRFARRKKLFMLCFCAENIIAMLTNWVWALSTLATSVWMQFEQNATCALLSHIGHGIYTSFVPA